MSPFLIIYHRSTGEVSVEQFPDAISAMKARLKHESEVGDDVEVVVLGSESRQKLRETHSRYFKNPTEILENSRELMSQDRNSA